MATRDEAGTTGQADSERDETAEELARMEKELMEGEDGEPPLKPVPQYAKEGDQLKPGQSRVKVIDLSNGAAAATLPSNQHTFMFEHFSIEENRMYEARLTVRRLTVPEQAAVASEAARLNAGVPKSEFGTTELNYALVSLRRQIIVRKDQAGKPDVPAWLLDDDNVPTFARVYDVTVIRRIWMEVLKWEDTFRGPAIKLLRAAQADRPEQPPA